MNYDKDSFLAGISVGRSLKGWSGAGGGGSASEYKNGIIFGSDFSITGFEYNGVILSENTEPVISGEYSEVV